MELFYYDLCNELNRYILLEELHSVIVLYKVQKVSGELKINDYESSELRYFEINYLPALEKRAEGDTQRITKTYYQNIRLERNATENRLNNNPSKKNLDL